MKENEAKLLAHNIILDIESNKKDLNLLCLEVSRLALLLHDKDKSEYFINYLDDVSKSEIFLKSYGLLVEKIVEKVDIDLLYELDDPLSSEAKIKKLSRTLEAANVSIYNFNSNRSELRNPNNDIRLYNIYQENYTNIKSKIYKYSMNVYYQLKLSENVGDIMDTYQEIINSKLPTILPNSRDKLDSISNSLKSENKEDWSNAVHQCRKLLQDLADKLYPPINNEIKQKGKMINMGEKKYINRLIAYIEDKSTSEKFIMITGSNIKYIGERLDAVYESANKGSHETIQTLEEAKRYIIYTYLFIGDILSL